MELVVSEENDYGIGNGEALGQAGGEFTHDSRALYFRSILEIGCVWIAKPL